MGICDFETLTPLYWINTRETLGRALSFTACGSRIVELRDRKVKIWEPPVLIRKASEDDSTISGSVAVAAVVGYEEQEDIEPITALCAHPTQDIIFVGKDDGTVNTYSARTGKL